MDNIIMGIILVEWWKMRKYDFHPAFRGKKSKIVSFAPFVIKNKVIRKKKIVIIVPYRMVSDWNWRCHESTAQTRTTNIKLFPIQFSTEKKVLNNFNFFFSLFLLLFYSLCWFYQIIVHLFHILLRYECWFYYYYYFYSTSTTFWQFKWKKFT